MTDQVDRLKAALADRYAIERELGTGGMATVYLAQDLKHHRQVAIKVLSPDLAAALGAERFLREIEIAAGLSHPHILPLYDSGEADGCLYYVMPYVEGESLRDRLRREQQLPIDDALLIAREVADGLGYAHSRGVIHRDIKPENILLSGRHAVIADFGIARAISVAGGGQLTETGLVIGTPTYMSPEQVSGERRIDGRSDIYALGCVLYEMLAGAPPYTGPSAQVVMARHSIDAVPPLKTARPTIAASVEAAITKTLAKVPADRFATASAFAEAIGMPELQRLSVEPAAAAAARAPVEKSIAVLPFADMSPDKDQEYFCDGMAEELINALMKIEQLRVASRTSAFAFKGKDQDIRRIGEQLNVRTLLEGSVRKSGNRLRITAQLITVDDGYHMWSERYDREMEDVFAIQEQIAESIARALRVVLSEREKRAIAQVPTTNVRAYEYYLRGRRFFHEFRRKSFEFAQQMFTRAIEIDQSYARAYTGLADCYSFLYMYFDSSEDNLKEADTASEKALELEPDLPEAHATRALAVSLNGRYDEARTEFETAIRLDPKLFEAYYFYARACRAQGNAEEAARLYEEAARVRPEDYQAAALLAGVYRGLGREVDAEAAARRALQIMENHLELHPDDARALYLGAAILGVLGEDAGALDWAGRALAIDSQDPVVLYNVACVYSLLHQIDDAIQYLAQAIEHGYAHREWIETDSDLDPLRADARFKALLTRM